MDDDTRTDDDADDGEAGGEDSAPDGEEGAEDDAGNGATGGDDDDGDPPTAERLDRLGDRIQSVRSEAEDAVEGVAEPEERFEESGETPESDDQTIAPPG